MLVNNLPKEAMLKEAQLDMGRLTLACESTLQQARALLRFMEFSFDFTIGGTAPGAPKTQIQGTIKRILQPGT